MTRPTAPSSVEPDKDNATEGWGAAAKAVWTPIRDEDSVVHLAFRGAIRRPETGNEAITFRDETTHMWDYHVVDTSRFSVPPAAPALQNVQEIIL